MHARLYVNARIWSAAPVPPGAPSEVLPAPGAIAERDGRIAAIGTAAELRRQFPGVHELDLDERLVTPGLIDCHTHIVHAGNRASEIERRMAGESYESIARGGGGILSTVAATRAATQQELTESALPRVDALLAEGVTTLEVKSGYGLEFDTELRMLRAARAIGESRLLSVITTYLGAHALPVEFSGDAAGYMEKLCLEWIPAMAASGVADAFDAYGEHLAFTPAQVSAAFSAARACGLPLKLHADQLSNQQGAALAARHGALSADHLEYTDDAGVAAMAGAGTVAVLLPGAYYFLRERQRPPVASLRRLRVPMAVATDCNPGTSPLTSMLLAMNLAAVEFGLSTSECLLGATREAARALGCFQDSGSIEAGKWCDLAVWNVTHPAELVYNAGARPLHSRIWHGQPDA
ncbi:MAG TPA: imidazolonepropionase [Steroidobacteraceae bacterium]|nr:imidazolonepropionase [Steroidobacteraceae bacterium]